MGDSAHIAATTPCCRALGFWTTSILSSAPGTTSSEVMGAFPRELPATENRMWRSPMLYVQLQIWTKIISALVDSGACDNFISAHTVADMHLEVRPPRVTTRILSANGQPMEYASYVVVTAVLGALSFPLSIRVVPSSIRVILGFPFLHQFNPRISWRAGTLTIEHG